MEIGKEITFKHIIKTPTGKNRIAYFKITSDLRNNTEAKQEKLFKLNFWLKSNPAQKTEVYIMFIVNNSITCGITFVNGVDKVYNSIRRRLKDEVDVDYKELCRFGTEMLLATLALYNYTYTTSIPNLHFNFVDFNGYSDYKEVAIKSLKDRLLEEFSEAPTNLDIKLYKFYNFNSRNTNNFILCSFESSIRDNGYLAKMKDELGHICRFEFGDDYEDEYEDEDEDGY
jgi:hypothetical protein